MAEKEYIGVEKLLDDIGEPPKWTGYEPYPFEEHLLACSLIKAIRNLIKEQPIANVQEVVLCEHCKHLNCISAVDREFYCRHPNGLKGCINPVEEKPFCSFGERKESDRNEQM